MSTILKALDRLEREKREPLARTLQQEIVTPAGSPTPKSVSSQRSPSFLAALAVGLGVGVGGIGMWLAARQHAAPAGMAAVVASALPAVAPQAQVAAAAAPEVAWRIEANAGEPADPLLLALGETADAAAAASDAPQFDQEVAVAGPEGLNFVVGETPVLDPAEGARPESEPLAAVAVVTPPPVARPEAAVAPLVVTKVAAPAPRVGAAAATPGPAPAPAALSAPKAAPKPLAKPASKPKSLPKSKPAPVAVAASEATADLPRARGASAPEVSVVSTVWHPAGERRHALVRLHSGETREVREGDSVDGLLVDRIEPSRVVFATGGIELVRRVGAGR